MTTEPELDFDLEDLIEKAEVISRPGAKVVVTELQLTDAGRHALSTGSAGIMDGAHASQYGELEDLAEDTAHVHAHS